MKKLIVKQIKSTIGQSENQRRTIKGLGLGKINREVSVPDSLPIRGMITKVQHLVTVRIENA